MRPGDTDLQFAPIDDGLRKVLPVFGAHPLSNIFNQAPVLLLEGDDDERIWQQAVRSSQVGSRSTRAEWKTVLQRLRTSRPKSCASSRPYTTMLWGIHFETAMKGLPKLVIWARFKECGLRAGPPKIYW